MVRFQPDGWLEALLRPFIMMDPSGGIYFEGMAPDWRFGLFAGVLFLATVMNRQPVDMPFPARQLALGLAATLYLWVFTIGNGRYYMAGLLMIGPLLVLAWRSLPGTQTMRYALLAGLVLLQYMAMASSYKPNQWGLAEWTEGQAVDLEASALREQPAVFVTATAISYSILVPQFHPQSRWANVVGQRDIVPQMREYKPLLEMLRGPLPKFVVMPMPARPETADNQPTPQIRQVYGDLLRPLGLTLSAPACTPLRSRLAPGPPADKPVQGIVRGFWVCGLDYSEDLRQSGSQKPVVSSRVAEAFQRVEQRCPRFFPAGNSTDRMDDRLVVRQYGSDMRLMADASGLVSFKYFRALNPTPLGPLEQVLRDEFVLPCDKPPGRYVPPWVSH